MDLIATSAPTSLKRNSAAVFGLITVLLITKRSLVLLKVPPLRSDPCDAVGAFALITIAFVVVVSSFDRYRKGPLSALQGLYDLRSQQAVVLAVFITITADAVALGRHPAIWISVVSPIHLFALLGTLAVVAVATQLLIFVAQRTPTQAGSTRWRRVAFTALLAIAVLIFCPEWPIDNNSTTAHILTVAIGALVLLVPMRLLLPELVPYRSDGHRESSVASAAREWMSLVAGVLMGAFGFWVNARNSGGALRHMHLAVVVLAIAGLLVAYSFLGAPLGFAGSLNNVTIDLDTKK